LLATVRSPSLKANCYSSLVKLLAAKLQKKRGAVMIRSITSSCTRAIALGALIALTGCAVYAEPVPVHHAEPVHIPPGHLPPPGECRIWYPDRPPGHQPPPGPCHQLQYQVPPGAVLVQG
jgi:hypothetical protein